MPSLKVDQNRPSDEAGEAGNKARRARARFAGDNISYGLNEYKLFELT